MIKNIILDSNLIISQENRHNLHIYLFIPPEQVLSNKKISLAQDLFYTRSEFIMVGIFKPSYK